ncbi:hypothetical protein KIPB_001358 [Kipferlia bialata]|uniref:Dynein heavy chain linker domain-containing protein n=1 Tax=Kipferlia bialata TaxID=797122 RepID=A0A9K3CNU9_9EUKA|nr:hypothetical protein KIPB_001358 [Kipferlia bialata]|eukprot:g1358.t1
MPSTRALIGARRLDLQTPHQERERLDRLCDRHRRRPRLNRSHSSMGDLSPFHKAASLFADTAKDAAPAPTYASSGTQMTPLPRARSQSVLGRGVEGEGEGRGTCHTQCLPDPLSIPPHPTALDDHDLQGVSVAVEGEVLQQRRKGRMVVRAVRGEQGVSVSHVGDLPLSVTAASREWKIRSASITKRWPKHSVKPQQSAKPVLAEISEVAEVKQVLPTLPEAPAESEMKGRVLTRGNTPSGVAISGKAPPRFPLGRKKSEPAASDPQRSLPTRVNTPSSVLRPSTSPSSSKGTIGGADGDRAYREEDGGVLLGELGSSVSEEKGQDDSENGDESDSETPSVSLPSTVTAPPGPHEEDTTAPIHPALSDEHMPLHEDGAGDGSPVVDVTSLAIKSIGLGLSFIHRLRRKSMGQLGRLSLSTAVGLNRVPSSLDEAVSGSVHDSPLFTPQIGSVVPKVREMPSKLSVMSLGPEHWVGGILPIGMQVQGYARLPEFTDLREWVEVTVVKIDRETGRLEVRLVDPVTRVSTAHRLGSAKLRVPCGAQVESDSVDSYRSIHVSQFLTKGSLSIQHRVSREGHISNINTVSLDQLPSLDAVPCVDRCQEEAGGTCPIGLQHTIHALHGGDLFETERVGDNSGSPPLSRSLMGDHFPQSHGRPSLVQQAKDAAETAWRHARQAGIARLSNISTSSLPADTETLTDIMFESVGTSKLQRSFPLSKSVWHTGDACKYRIGREAFQQRAAFLEDNLMYLDPASWGHMYRFKAITNTRIHYLGVDGDEGDYDGIPDTILSDREHCTFQEYAEHNKQIAEALRALLDDAVRNHIHRITGDASWADLDSTLETEIAQFKKSQLHSILKGARRPAGTVLTIEVDVECIRNKAFNCMKERRERLIQLLDFMVLSMLHSASEDFALSWLDGHASLESQYLTKPIWRAGLKHNLMDVTQPCGHWEPRQPRELLFWPHLPGSSLVQASRGAVIRLPLEVVPDECAAGYTAKKTPCFLDADSSHFSMYVEILSTWERTRSVTSFTPPTVPYLSNGISLADVVDPMKFKMSQAQSLGHQMGVFIGVSRRFAQRLILGDEKLKALTGYSTFDAMIEGISPASVGSDEVFMPPMGLGSLGITPVDTSLEGSQVSADSLTPEEADPRLALSPLNTALIEGEWAVVAEYTEFVAKIPPRAFYLNAVSHADAVLVVLKEYLEGSRVSLRERHSKILITAIQATLHCIREVWKESRRAVVLPEDYDRMVDLLQKVNGAAARWVAASVALNTFADAMLTHGTFIPLECHIAMIRIKRFSMAIPMLNDISQTVSDTCKSLLGLSTSTQAQLADPDYSDSFSFLSVPFVFPPTRMLHDMVMGFEPYFSRPLAESRTDFAKTLASDTQEVWAETEVNEFLAASGLIIAFASITGFPALPDLDQYPSVTEIRRRVTVDGEEAKVPIELYQRPAERGEIDLERVLQETIQLIERGRAGIRQIKLWADLSQVQGIVLSPSMQSLDGDVFLLHNCMGLIRRARSGEEMLQSSPVDELDIESINDLMQDIERCLQFMRISFDNKAGVHNMTFATELEAVRDRMQPGVELMRLVTVPSLMHRHLDILESSSSLPVLQMASISIHDLIDRGALDKLEEIQAIVQLAEDEARVERNLDMISKVMESWKATVDTSPGINGGFSLPPHFETSIRSMALYVQRDVASKYCTPITQRARQLEANILWVKLNGSLLMYTQDYLLMADKLMSRNKDFAQKYNHVCHKWWQFRRSVDRVARTRLLSVLLDTSLGDLLSSMLSGLVPFVKTLQQKTMCWILHTSNHMAPTVPAISNGILKHIHCMPNMLGYAMHPTVLPICHPIVKATSLPGEMIVLGPHMLFGIDSFLVRPVTGSKSQHLASDKDGAREADTEDGDALRSVSAQSSRRPPLPPSGPMDPTKADAPDEDQQWEVTAVVSGVLYGGPVKERTEILRLTTPVSMPQMVGAFPHHLREPIEAAVLRDMRIGLKLLDNRDMAAFGQLCYQVRYMAVNYWVHMRLREGIMSHDAILGLSAAVLDLKELAGLLVAGNPDAEGLANVHLQTLVLKWIDEAVPQTQDTVTSNINLPVLSAPCITRHQFAAEGQFTVSASGVELKHHSLDWLGGPTAYEIPEPGSDVGPTCSFSLKTVVTLLARGVTCALCTNRTESVHTVIGPLTEIGRLTGQTVKILAATSYPTPSGLAHQVGNLLLDGFLVVLTGLESSTPEFKSIVHSLATSLYNGGEFAYTSPSNIHGVIPPYLSCPNCHFGCTRNPLGSNQQHPDEHTLGSLVLHLAVLNPGAFRMDSSQFPGDPIRYTDARPPSKKMKYHPSSATRPCLALITMLRRQGIQILPGDLEVALRLGSHDDTHASAVYKYLSVQTETNQLDGLRSIVHSAFGIDTMPAVEWGPPEECLTGEGVYAAEWLVGMGEKHKTLAVQTRHPLSLVHSLRDTVSSTGGEVIYLSHPVLLGREQGKLGVGVPETAAYLEMMKTQGGEAGVSPSSTDTDPDSEELSETETDVDGFGPSRLAAEPAQDASVIYLVVNMTFDPEGKETGTKALQQSLTATRSMCDSRRVVVIYLGAQRMQHNALFGPTLHFRESMIRQSHWYRKAIEQLTGIVPSTTASDPSQFFLGTIAKFCEMFHYLGDRTVLESEGSMILALVIWLMSERGYAEILPIEGEVDSSPDEDGNMRFNIASPEVIDPYVFGLANVGSGVSIQLDPEFLEESGDTGVGRLVSLFVCAFCVTYNAFTILSAVQDEFSRDMFIDAVSMTTSESALEQLKTVHPEFAALPEAGLESILGSVSPERFQCVGYDPETLSLTIAPLRDPIDMNDWSAAVT